MMRSKWSITGEHSIMSIGNILLGLIALCMVALVMGAIYAFFYFKDGVKLKEQSTVIEVESVNPDLTQGYGFIVDGKVVLNDNKTPMLIKTKKIAEELLVEAFCGKGEIVYQKWDVDKQQLILGKVQKRGAN